MTRPSQDGASSFAVGNGSSPALIFSDPQQVQLNPFAGDPIFRSLAARQVKPGTLLIFPVLVFSLAAIFSGSYGDFSQPFLGRDLCHDAAIFLPGQPKWSCLKSYSPDTKFSLLRDLPTLMCFLVIGLIPRLIYRQWSGLRDLFPSMSENKVLGFATEEAADSFRREVAQANSWFERVGRCGALVALAAAILVAPIIAAEGRGVFPLLFSGDRTRATQAAYSEWWASFQHPAAWSYYTSVMAIGAYYVILMNLIGSRAILTLWRIRSIITATASVENVDGAFGWKQAREVLAASYVATALYAITLAGMSVVLPTDVIWVLSLFFLQWLLVLPFYLYIPLRQIRISISAYKASESQLARMRISVLAGSTEPAHMHEAELLAQRLERIRRIRALPFRALRDVSIAVFTILASAASIYAAATLWYNLQ